MKTRKLSTNRNKPVLQGCLLGAIDAPVGMGEQERCTNEHVPHFAPGAKWKQLSINSVPILEPNRNSNLIALTIPTGEKECTKYNFDDIFDHPPFTAKSKTISLIGMRGQVMKDKDGKPKYEEEVREKG